MVPYKKYASRDGLLSDRVTAINQDEKGFMWFGSYFGICRYDGRKFDKIDLPPSQQNKYVTFLEPAGGKMYAGFLFSVGGKMFCVTSLEPPFTCSFKVSDEEFEELSGREGFVPAPYMARAKWVMVKNADRLHKKEWEAYIRQSYELVKAKLTKKERAGLGLA